MHRGVIEVGPQRYRATLDRAFEAFVIGDVYEHRRGLAITEQRLVTIRTTGRNQNGVVICEFERTMLIWKQGFSPVDS